MSSAAKRGSFAPAAFANSFRSVFVLASVTSRNSCFFLSFMNRQRVSTDPSTFVNFSCRGVHSSTVRAAVWFSMASSRPVPAIFCMTWSAVRIVQASECAVIVQKDFSCNAVEL